MIGHLTLRAYPERNPFHFTACAKDADGDGRVSFDELQAAGYAETGDSETERVREEDEL